MQQNPSPDSTPAELDTRQRLLQAAIREFAIHGFEQGTVRGICQQAQANLNAVKYYFGDKQNLYVEAVKAAHHDNMGRGILEADRIAEQFAGAPTQRLGAIILGMVTMALSARDRGDYKHLLMFREIGNPGVATEHLVRDFIRPHFDRLNLVLEEMLPTGTDVIRRKLLAFSIVGQCMHYKMASGIMPLLLSPQEQEQLTPQRVAEHILAVTQAAIAAIGEEEATT